MLLFAIALVGKRTGQILREKAPYKQSINSVMAPNKWTCTLTELLNGAVQFCLILKTKTLNFLRTFQSGHWLLVKWWMQSYFRIWSSLPWSLLWAGFTLQTIFRLSSLFFFTMSLNNVCSFSYSSSHVVNTSKHATMIYALKIKEILRIS